MRPLVTVVIPAHNEGAYIGKCLECVKAAASRIEPQETEIIVVANRCTDDTAEVARSYGARVVTDESRCIAAVRNAGRREGSFW